MTADAQAAVAKAMTERALAKCVQEALTAFGYVAYHTWLSINSRKGFPDIVAYRERDRRMVVFELKREGKDPTPEQVWWLDAFASLNILSRVIRPSDWYSGRVEELLR